MTVHVIFDKYLLPVVDLWCSCTHCTFSGCTICYCYFEYLEQWRGWFHVHWWRFCIGRVYIKGWLYDEKLTVVWVDNGVFIRLMENMTHTEYISTILQRSSVCIQTKHDNETCFKFPTIACFRTAKGVKYKWLYTHYT